LDWHWQAHLTGEDLEISEGDFRTPEWDVETPVGGLDLAECQGVLVVDAANEERLAVLGLTCR
jgi:hypothetical protein